MFLYPESGIEWVRGTGKNRNKQDAQAQAGFMSGEGESFLLDVSGKDQMKNIDSWSNTDVPGLWIYKVGPTVPLENILPPSSGVRAVSDPRTAKTCQAGRAACHSKAWLVILPRGFYLPLPSVQKLKIGGNREKNKIILYIQTSPPPYNPSEEC